jgi:hypothetical protein
MKFKVQILILTSDWYVSPAIGNDNPTAGNETFPFASVGYGISLAQPGDSILLMPGDYLGNIEEQLEMNSNLSEIFIISFIFLIIFI